MSYLDEFISKLLLKNFKTDNNKRRNIIIGIVTGLGSLFFISGGIYYWYIQNYLPSNYGLKTIGIVYNLESGRKSARLANLHYKINAIIYDVTGEVNSYENYKNKQIQIGDTFCILYYPTHPDWAKVDFFTDLPIDTSKHVSQKIKLPNTLDIILQIDDEYSHKSLKNFETHVSSSSMSEVYHPDSTGHIEFLLPPKEDIYRIKISCNNYVSKILEVDTRGINKEEKNLFFLPAIIELIKEEKGIDYSVLEKPVAKGKLINDSTFDWDYKYSEKIKEEITNVLHK